MKYFSHYDKLKIIETMDNSVMAAIEVIKTRDTILEYYPNALIIFKHDHLYPPLRGIIQNSSIDDSIKNSFLYDNTPTPILIWDGTNGAYKAPDNFVPENIPMFIALNAGVTNYKNSIISLLYKEEINGFISTYHKYYKVTNDTLISENNISKDSEIFKYENAQRILSQDIFQGKKHYYNLIKKAENRLLSTGFYKGEVTTNEQLYDLNLSVPTKNFIGLVLSCDNGICKIEQRNYFTSFSDIEVFTPKASFIINVGQLYDEDGNLVDVARHPRQVLYFKTDYKLEPYDMLRAL